MDENDNQEDQEDEVQGIQSKFFFTGNIYGNKIMFRPIKLFSYFVFFRLYYVLDKQYMQSLAL